MADLSSNTEEAAERVKKGLAEIARLLARQAVREALEKERIDADKNPDSPGDVP